MRRLNEAMALRGEGAAVGEWLVLALARHRLGHAVEARQWRDRAVQWLADNERRDSPGYRPEARPLPWPRRLQIQLLRQEVEKALRTGVKMGEASLSRVL